MAYIRAIQFKLPTSVDSDAIKKRRRIIEWIRTWKYIPNDRIHGQSKIKESCCNLYRQTGDDCSPVHVQISFVGPTLPEISTGSDQLKSLSFDTPRPNSTVDLGLSQQQQKTATNRKRRRPVQSLSPLSSSGPEKGEL